MPLATYSVTGLWEGYKLSELKERTLSNLKQKEGNYTRYSETNITNALNDGIIQAVVKTKCLKGFAIIILKDGYSQYKPPSQLLEIDKAYFYQSATSYYEIAQKSITWLNRFKPGWKVQNGDPKILYPGDSYGNLRKIGFTPTPDTDGDDYISSPDTGIYASSSGITTSGNVTGTNTTAHATTCTDSEGRTLSDEGIVVGMMAVNVTDGSSGQITAVTGSTFSCTLADGTSDTWAVGDSFTILAGEYGVVVDWENDEKFIFSSEIGGMIDVTALTGNIYLTFVKRPIRLRYDNQYPELPPELHEFLSDYAVYSLKRTSPRGSKDYEEAMAAFATFEKGIDENYVSQDTNLIDDWVMDYNL